MADQHRPGDWMHRNGRSHEASNDIVKDPNAKKWYDDIFWIVFFLVLFWPVGLVLMWRSRWNAAVKIIVTAVIAVAVFFAASMYQAVSAYNGSF